MMDKEYTRSEFMERLGLSYKEYFRTEYLNMAIEIGLVELTIPDKPTSSKQKYKLTQKGKNIKAQ